MNVCQQSRISSRMSRSAKVALVTGSTSGIGLAIAHALAKNGVDVIVNGFGEELTITGIVNELRTRYGVTVHYLAADLSQLSDIDSLWSGVLNIHPNGIDILINNAGLGIPGPLESVTDDYWNKIVAVNLTASFQLIKRCLPAMKQKGYGRIVNMSSVLGVAGHPDYTVYCATKHGLVGLTKGVALETAAHGITCNAVCPGFTQTPLIETYKKFMAGKVGISIEDANDTLQSGIATGKYNTPEQVAELVEFLCLSNASSQMTGAAYFIDHGYTAQ